MHARLICRRSSSGTLPIAARTPRPRPSPLSATGSRVAAASLPRSRFPVDCRRRASRAKPARRMDSMVSTPTWWTRSRVGSAACRGLRRSGVAAQTDLLLESLGLVRWLALEQRAGGEIALRLAAVAVVVGPIDDLVLRKRDDLPQFHGLDQARRVVDASREFGAALLERRYPDELAGVVVARDGNLDGEARDPRWWHPCQREKARQGLACLAHRRRHIGIVPLNQGDSVALGAVHDRFGAGRAGDENQQCREQTHVSHVGPLGLIIPNRRVRRRLVLASAAHLPIKPPWVYIRICAEFIVFCDLMRP